MTIRCYGIRHYSGNHEVMIIQCYVYGMVIIMNQAPGFPKQNLITVCSFIHILYKCTNTECKLLFMHVFIGLFVQQFILYDTHYRGFFSSQFSHFHVAQLNCGMQLVERVFILLNDYVHSHITHKALGDDLGTRV